MVVNNPNNWHWVDKNCIDWTKTYLNDKLLDLCAEENDKNVKISSISSVEGDVEVCQRKGKVISLFDLKVVLSISGFAVSSAKEEGGFSGSITVPELAYDSTEDDLQFEISIYNENSENEVMRAFIKKHLIPKLRTILAHFGVDLIRANSNDIQIASEKVNSKLTQENQRTSLAGADVKATKTTGEQDAKSCDTTEKNGPQESNSYIPKYNTSTLHFEPVFNTTAEQIYLSLLDKNRVSAWTRSQVSMDEFPPKVGSSFSLFGGSVTGKLLSLTKNEKISQLWRLEDWKKGHYAQLDIQLSQGQGETKMVVKWSGIPVGEEDRVRNNFEEYYVRSIKIVFGFGAVL